MKRDYIKYFVGLAACSFLGLTSCDDDKDLGGKMDEMITVSTITLNETQYDAGNKTICLLKNKELQLSWSIAPENATDAMCNGLRRMNLLLLLHGKVRS